MIFKRSKETILIKEINRLNRLVSKYNGLGFFRRLFASKLRKSITVAAANIKSIADSPHTEFNVVEGRTIVKGKAFTEPLVIGEYANNSSVVNCLFEDCDPYAILITGAEGINIVGNIVRKGQ